MLPKGTFHRCCPECKNSGKAISRHRKSTQFPTSSLFNMYQTHTYTFRHNSIKSKVRSINRKSHSIWDPCKTHVSTFALRTHCIINSTPRGSCLGLFCCFCSFFSFSFFSATHPDEHTHSLRHQHLVFIALCKYIIRNDFLV